VRKRAGAALVMIIGLVALGQPDAGAVPLPKNDSFYTYTGGTPLAAITPGTVLKTRTVNFHINGSTSAFNGFQLLYRTTGQRGQAVTTVASVIKPNVVSTGQLVSDQYPYDALDGKCDTSYYVSGASNNGGTTVTAAQTGDLAFLAAGDTVVTSDYEGEDLAWTAGQQSGMQTLDGIRAALNSTDVGLPSTAKVGILGYSGGAIASEWATELAPKYAPDVNSKLVGTAIGGIYVYPAHNLKYVSGTTMWSGVMPGALVGVARGFGINLNTYASPYGKKLFDYAKDKCIGDLLSKYPGLTFAQLVKKQYANFASVPAFVKLNNKLIMGSGGTPTVPYLMAQGLNGEADGSPGNKPGIGAGDGVMIAADVRALARKYCAHVPVQYDEYPGEHVSTFAPFLTTAEPWLASRFAGVAAPNDCATIQPGNSLAPLPTPKPSTSPSTTSVHHAQPASVHHAVTAGGTEIAATGADTQRLLLWALLLVGLGSGLLWTARAPRPAPIPVRRRPLPYPRD
jgi:hypothetical protein